MATVAGVSVDRALAACTHGKRRPTSDRDLRRGLAALGHELASFVRTTRARPGSALALAQLADAPALFVRVRFAWRRSGYHWVVFTQHHVYDPSLPRVVTRYTWFRLIIARQGHVTSVAPVHPRSVSQPRSDGAC